jgi:hypothetical protein
MGETNSSRARSASRALAGRFQKKGAEAPKDTTGASRDSATPIGIEKRRRVEAVVVNAMITITPIDEPRTRGTVGIRVGVHRWTTKACYHIRPAIGDSVVTGYGLGPDVPRAVVHKYSAWDHRPRSREEFRFSRIALVRDLRRHQLAFEGRAASPACRVLPWEAS